MRRMTVAERDALIPDREPDAPIPLAEFLALDLSHEEEDDETTIQNRPTITNRDADLAAVVVWIDQTFATDARFDYTRKQWHLLDAVGHWAPDRTEQVYERIEAATRRAMSVAGLMKDEIVALTSLLDRGKQRSVLDTLAHRSSISLVGNEFDKLPHLLGVGNGVVDLRDGSLRLGRPEDMVSRSTGIDFDSAASCPRFEAFLAEIMSDDPERIAFLRRWLGYSLWGFSREQKFALWVGSGQNGKGVLKRIVRHVLGDYAIELPPTLYMKTKSGSATANTPRPELVELQGKRIGLGSEPEGGTLNEEMVKAHSGEDEIRARRLYSNSILNFYPSHSINLLTNLAPSVTDVGVSMARRLLVIPFEEAFTGPREDLGLYETLRAESAGILALLIREAVAYGQVGLGTIPEKVRMASSEFLDQNNPLTDWLGERVIREPDATSTLAELYADYCTGVTVPMNDVSFGLRLHYAGFRKAAIGSRGQQRKVWRGLRLRTLLDE